MTSDSGFTLQFDANESPRYPHGYWYACTNDGNYDATGNDPLQALAALTTIIAGVLSLKELES